MSRRRRQPPSPAEPLEDDGLLSEILLRLPPDPSSLPRASAVSRRWRGLASDRRFSRRFRAHHRRSPPLLGCFVEESHRTFHFEPALEAPNRVPRGRFSVPIVASSGRSWLLGCRHGLALVFHADPRVGPRRRRPAPPRHSSWRGLRDTLHQRGGASSCRRCPTLPGGLGFSARLWKRKTDCGDGAASWVLGETIALDTLLSINSTRETFILGFAEQNNAVLLWTSIGVFTFQLDSLEFKKLFEAPAWYRFYPFQCVYVADKKSIEGGHDGAELLQNT